MLALFMILGSAELFSFSEKSQLLQQKVLKEYERDRERAVFGGIIENEYFVNIPAGSFRMGNIQGDDYYSSQYPQPSRRVSIKAFLLARMEVTFAEWDACVIDGGCLHRPSDEGRGAYPVVNVSYDYIIEQYIPWLNRVTGKSYRLPTEAEWEYAARAGTETSHFFGADATDFTGNNPGNDYCGYANIEGREVFEASGEIMMAWDKELCSDGSVGAAIVGSYLPNSFGLYDMYGNVEEFTQDCWNRNYRRAPLDGSAWLSGICDLRITRGGSWATSIWDASSFHRSGVNTDIDYASVGFRLARSLD